MGASIAAAEIVPLTGPPELSGYTDSRATRFLANGELLYYVSGSLGSGFASMACLYSGGTSTALSLGGANSSVLGTNSLGDIVGRAQLADGTFHGFLRRSGTITDLGTLGGSESEATAVNAAGVVVGFARDAFGRKRAFGWENGTMTALATPFGSESWATGINLSGDIVGEISTAGYRYPVLWRGGSSIDLVGQTGLYYPTGSIHTITDSGHVFFQATGVNDYDETVSLPYVYAGGTVAPLTLDGSTGTFSGASPAGEAIGYGRTPSGNTHAFLWSAGSFTDLTQLTGLTDAFGYPERIQPTTVGFRSSGLDSDSVAQDLFFIYREGQAFAASLGGGYSAAYDLNGIGEAVGVAATAGGVNHAFRWSNGQTIDLGASWWGESLAYATNATGTASGYYVAEDSSFRACVFRESAIEDLGVDSSYSYAHLVSEDGLVAGEYMEEDFSSVAFIHVPDPTGNHAPVADAGTDQTFEATGPSTSVTISGSGTDEDGDSLTYSWFHNGVNVGTDPSVSLSLPLGSHVLSLVVTDLSGASDSDEVAVTLQDTAAPSIQAIPQNIVAFATSSMGAVIDYAAPTATDAVDGTVSVECNPSSGSVFPLGATTVACVATDASGNSSRAAFDVRVQYSWSGFLSPKAGSLKAGRIVDVRFKLTGASAAVENAAATLLMRRVGSPDFQTVGSFSFVPGADRYEVAWNTANLPTGSYELKVDLRDGVERTTTVNFK